MPQSAPILRGTASERDIFGLLGNPETINKPKWERHMQRAPTAAPPARRWEAQPAGQPSGHPTNQPANQPEQPEHPASPAATNLTGLSQMAPSSPHQPAARIHEPQVPTQAAIDRLIERKAAALAEYDNLLASNKSLQSLVKSGQLPQVDEHMNLKRIILNTQRLHQHVDLAKKKKEARQMFGLFTKFGIEPLGCFFQPKMKGWADHFKPELDHGDYDDGLLAIYRKWFPTGLGIPPELLFLGMLAQNIRAYTQGDAKPKYSSQPTFHADDADDDADDEADTEDDDSDDDEDLELPASLQQNKQIF